MCQLSVVYGVILCKPATFGAYGPFKSMIRTVHQPWLCERHDKTGMRLSIPPIELTKASRKVSIVFVGPLISCNTSKVEFNRANKMYD